jgi:hypothetical protein
MEEDILSDVVPSNIVSRQVSSDRNWTLPSLIQIFLLPSQAREWTEKVNMMNNQRKMSSRVRQRVRRRKYVVKTK